MHDEEGGTLHLIYHIVSEKKWKEALDRGIYLGDTLETEGFIHASEIDQVIEVANTLFAGQKGLVLLVIDRDKLISPIKYEDPGNGDLFPHIYGSLNLDAVVDVVSFEPTADGTFQLPDEIRHVNMNDE